MPEAKRRFKLSNKSLTGDILSGAVKHERYIFLAMVFLNLLPVLVFPNVLSYDGATHVYNAQMIKEYLSGDFSSFSEFFEWNHIPSPNWAGHFIMAIFQYCVPPYTSEKLLLILILLFTPYSFRYLIKCLTPQRLIGSYFSLIFTYNGFQFSGFYNFLFAFIPSFYLLGYFVKHIHSFSIRNFIVTGLLLTLVYFSHAFMYLVCLLTLAIIFFIQLVEWKKQRSIQNKGIVIKTALGLLLTVSPSVLLFLIFYFSHTVFTIIYLDPSEIWRMFITNASFIWVMTQEELMTIPLQLAICGMAVIALVAWVRKFKKIRSIEKPDAFIVSTLFLFIFLFTLPDSDGGSGFYTIRTLFLINVFLLLIIALIRMHKTIFVIGLLLMLSVHAKMLLYYSGEFKKHQPTLIACNHAGIKIEPNKLVLPINAGDWVYAHTGIRAATVNKAISLENYEACVSYFPFLWNNSKMKRPVFPCCEVPPEFRTWPLNKVEGIQLIDYVFIIGNIDAVEGNEYLKLKDILQRDYDLIFEESRCYLFRLKRGIIPKTPGI